MHEDNIEDWIPPELLERAKIAAERDAASAERLAQQQAKPTKKQRKRKGLGAPEPRNPRFAFVMAGLCAIFLLAGRIAGMLAAGPGSGSTAVILLDWASSVLTLLLYLKFMLPAWKPHRASLGVLLVCRLASDIAYIAFRAAGIPEPAKKVSIFFLSALMSSPLMMLLYGLLRRRSTEKAAGLLQLLIVSTVLPIGLYNEFTAQNVMKLLQAGCMVFFLINWPVLKQPASFEKAIRE